MNNVYQQPPGGTPDPLAGLAPQTAVAPPQQPIPIPQPESPATRLELAVTARRRHLATVRKVEEQVYENTVWVCRCPDCGGVAIIFREGFDPNGASFGPGDWTSLYRPDASTPWYEQEIPCGDCFAIKRKSSIRASFNVHTREFTIIGRHGRFLEQLDLTNGRYVREMKNEAKAEEQRNHELLQLAQAGIMTGGLNHAV